MTEKTPDILALVLAGGRARRMEGRAKALLRLGGRRLIDLVIEKARAQCVAVALNLHDGAPETLAPFADLGLPVAVDAPPGRLGPLAGVLGGLDFAAARHPGAEFVLSLPCDGPFLPDDLAARLLKAARQTKSRLACAASGGRIHHVVALWPLGLREDLRRALLERHIRAVGEFQRGYDIATVEWPAALRDPFFNINAPEDLAHAEILLRGET